MTTIRIFNHGPGPIEIQDAAGRTSMGEGAGNLFQTPVKITKYGGEAVEQPTGGGPQDESPNLAPGGATADPDTEFEGLTTADAAADLAGQRRPDNPNRTGDEIQTGRAVEDDPVLGAEANLAAQGIAV